MKIQINNKCVTVADGSTFEDLCSKKYFLDSEFAMMGVINNKVCSLDTVIPENAKVRVITLKETEGHRVFMRSITYLFTYVVNQFFPNAEVEVYHTINRGEYCNIKNVRFGENELRLVGQEMERLIEQNLPFTKHVKLLDDLTMHNQAERLRLCKTINKDACTVYELNGYMDYSGGILVPSTGYLKNFDICSIGDNDALLLGPKKKDPSEIEEYSYQPNLMAEFDELRIWSEIHKIHYLADLNLAILNKNYKEMIRVCEALHEYKFAKVATEVKEKDAKVVFVTGPSSSGKTTSANRIRIQLMVRGSQPLIISMDDYFIDRDKMVRDENGNLDFECVEVVDLKEFKKQTDALLFGKKVKLRRFDFKTGKGYYDEEYTQLPAGSEIIVEGIHAFNPKVQELFVDYETYKVCVNPLSLINLDDHNRISSTDCRKIRRMVRDRIHRGFGVEETLIMWPNIRAGEEKNIYPYLESADEIINTTLVYELTVLKKYAEAALKEVSETSDCYIEAKRLLNVLSYFVSLEDESEIPKTSILQEFLS